MDVGTGCGAPQQSRPRLPTAFGDRRLRQVVDDQPQRRVPLGQGDDVFEMTRQDGDDVEGQLALGEQAQAVLDLLTDHPVRVRFVVDQVPDTHEPGIPAALVELRGGVVRPLQRHPSDDPGDPGPPVGDLEHVVGVLGGVGRLDDHRTIDPGRGELRLQFDLLERPVERAEVRGQPRVLDPVQIPQVLVGVDDRHHASLADAAWPRSCCARVQTSLSARASGPSSCSTRRST